MRIKHTADEKPEVNITPVIDMVFLLLIFFLVATKFADIERDIRVQPPSSSNLRPVTAVPHEIVINITREGQLLIAGQARKMGEVDSLLAAAIVSNPQQAVVIRGDKESVLQYAVNILDLCEKHKIAKTYLTTRREE